MFEQQCRNRKKHTKFSSWDPYEGDKCARRRRRRRSPERPPLVAPTTPSRARLRAGAIGSPGQREHQDGCTGRVHGASWCDNEGGSEFKTPFRGLAACKIVHPDQKNSHICVGPPYVFFLISGGMGVYTGFARPFHWVYLVQGSR